VPQLAGLVCAHTWCGSVPDATGVQVPTLPLIAQDMHAPEQSPSQHTPSEQKPLAQSLVPLHDWPRIFLHTPPTQLSLMAQACAQDMQWSWLVMRSAHPSAQQFCVDGQAAAPPHMQVVPTQLLPLSHDGTQVVFTHWPLMQA
jgi:hypothetical protein